MQSLAPIITVPRRFWDREYGGCPLPKQVTVTFEVAGQPVDDVSTQGYVSVAEDSELRLSGLWAVSQDRFPGHLVFGWSRVGEDTIKLQLQPPDSADEQGPGIDRKRQAPTDLSEPQAKVQALSARLALEWDSSREQAGSGMLLDWRPEGRDGARMAGMMQVEQGQRLVAPNLLPGARFGQRRGGSAGRMRGGSRTTATGRGCAKLVRTTTRLYIGVGQVREWLGEVGARTELQVKVMLDNRMLNGVHQADLLYNKGAHYYWITSRTLKRTAMGKWFLGWNHTPTDGLVLLLRSPSKDEIAAAIAEGFQGKDDDEDTEMSEQQQQLQQQLQQQQQQIFQALSPPSPHPNRMQSARSLAALGYSDEDAMMLLQQQPPASEVEDPAEGGQYHRAALLAAGARLGPAGDEDEAVSGLSGDSELRRALGPSDPRLMVAIAAAELQRGVYGGSGTPGASGLARRPTPGSAAGAGAGASRGFTGVRDSRELQQPLLGGRSAPGSGAAGGSGPAPYREPLGRTGSEGLAAGGTCTPPGQPRTAAPPPARFTNFSEVPGGTAFANVPLPSENLGLETQPQQQQQRGGVAAMPSQLGATTSIASNLSLGGATQLTGAASMLQASGVAGPIAAPLRLPTNVSELLPPEYLPAAVSVRCTLDGSLQPDIFACEIHRNRQGHCYLYNLPPTVLEGRSQQDWMISEDGCLVLCLQTAQQPNVLVENKSVRSNPSHPQGGLPLAAGSANPEATGTRGRLPSTGHATLDKPSMARPQRKNSDGDLTAAAGKPQPQELAPGTGVDPSPKAPDPLEQVPQLQQGQAMEQETTAAAVAAEPAFVVAALPVSERKPDGRRERTSQLLVPRMAIESFYGPVLLPHPVLLRYQIDGELEQQVYLAEVADAGAGELYVRGASMEPLVGRVLVSWGRGSVLSHQLLIVCLETRPEAAGQGKGGGAIGSRGGRDDEPRRPRNDHGPSSQLPQQQQPGGQQPPSHQQQQQTPPNWSTIGEAHLATSRPPANAAAANPFGQQQPALSAVTAAPGPSHPPHRASAQQHQQQGLAAPGASHHRQPPQQLQPVMSGPLPGVGSSMLPPSLSLMNNGSSLLPAQASNLPFSASVPRPEGNASAAVGAPASGRPVSAGGRGGAAGGSPAGQRSPSLGVDTGGGGGMLHTVASATQAPLQAPGSKAGATGRGPPAAPVFPWEGAAAGQAAPTVFAFGLGQEPSSPKAPVELSASGKRQHQQQQHHHQHAQGRGSGGSVLHSAAAESALAPRNTVQTADFSSANATSHVRGAHPFSSAPSHQQSMHQGPRRMDDDAEHELRRSPALGSGGASGSGDLDAAVSNRGGRRPQGPETEGLVLSALALGVQGESGPTMRYLPSQGAHGGSGSTMAAEPAGPSGQEPTQLRPRADRSQGPSHSWRFDVHTEQQRTEPDAGAEASNDDDLPESQPSMASLPAGGLLREASRWGESSAGGGEEGRGHAFARYNDEAYAPVAASGRAAGDDIDLAPVVGSGGVDAGQMGGTVTSSRPVAEVTELRPASAFQRRSEGAGVGWTGGPSRRSFGVDAADREDVEMEDAEPDAAPQPGRVEPSTHASGRAQLGLSAAAESNGIGGDKQPGQAMDVELQEAALSRHRRGDSGHQAPHEAPRLPFDQASGAAEASRQPHPLQGGGATTAQDHGKQQSTWYPRLDLSGQTASAQEKGGGDVAPGPKAGSGEEGRTGREEVDSGEFDRLPPRRGVLRMLSMVVHEMEGDEMKAQQPQQQ